MPRGETVWVLAMLASGFWIRIGRLTLRESVITVAAGAVSTTADGYIIDWLSAPIQAVAAGLKPAGGLSVDIGLNN